jgi:hypothetical protein
VKDARQPRTARETGWIVVTRGGRRRTRAQRAALLQADPAGELVELAGGDSEVLFAPSRFDAARPFVVALDLDPGTYRLSDQLWVGAPAR